MKKIVLLFSILFITGQIFGQNIEYARSVLKKLSSKGFHGRGYVKTGDLKAAKYIANQLKKNKVSPFDEEYFQQYSFPINTFPGKISIFIDDIKLKPGADFVISSSAGTIDDQFKIEFLTDTITTDTGFIQTIRSAGKKDVFYISNYYPRKIYGKTIEGIKGIIVLEDTTPAWHVSNGNSVQNTVWLKIKKSKMPDQARSLRIAAENVFISNYETQNVIGYVSGKTYPDRFIVFTAHYDHLGMMGNKTYFPGANDNGSGTALVLDLARHYALPENQPDYSIVFMLFSGEEAGLHGANYYVNNPIFRLQQIEFLINLDMVGTGSEGITVVNGKAYNDVMIALNKINDEHNYLAAIKARGEACNSDHCPFYKIGVKSIFIYTMGNEHTEYHTVTDVSENFPFSTYDNLFSLLTQYVAEIQE